MMKKAWLIILVVLLTSTLGVAQIQNKQETGAFAPEWEEFTVEESVAFASHKYADGSGFYYKDADHAAASPRNYTDKVGGTYYFIFSETTKYPYKSNKIAGFFKNSRANIETLQFGKLAGEKFKFTDEDGFYHTAILFKTRNRSYVFQTISDKENDAQAEHFLGSIKLHAVKIPSRIIPPKNFGSGIGTGNGGGMSDCRQGYRPLIITSRPEPAYNDFARIYDFSGIIEIKITFQANGEVGEIVPLIKLPFGLTNSTLAAARQIKFMPPAMNGVPYSETRVERYYLRY